MPRNTSALFGQLIRSHGVVVVSLFAVVGVESVTGNQPIRFDLAPVAEAGATETSGEVRLTLALSSIIETPRLPKIDQWIVRCRPRGERTRVVDYSPRTEVASDLASPIKVQEQSEDSLAGGLAFDGGYGHLANAHFGVDKAEKSSRSETYDRLPSVQAVTAAGSIDRGSGVYFKLRWTATQVLEGEKRFELTLSVPLGWRAGMIDVDVEASAFRDGFGGIGGSDQLIGQAHFTVVAFRSGDADAREAAWDLANAERHLRRVHENSKEDKHDRSLPGLIRSFAVKLDLNEEAAVENKWIERLVSGRADPHLDKVIVKLPMKLRLAALKYNDCVQMIERLGQTRRLSALTSTRANQYNDYGVYDPLDASPMKAPAMVNSR